MIIFLCFSSAGFNPIANAMSPEGQPNNANSLEACRQQCEASFTFCFSFDYDPNKATKCYLHFSRKNIITSQGVTHYIRVGKLHKLTKSQASFSLKDRQHRSRGGSDFPFITQELKGVEHLVIYQMKGNNYLYPMILSNRGSHAN